MASTRSGSFRGPCIAINGLCDQYHQAYHNHSMRHPPIGGGAGRATNGYPFRVLLMQSRDSAPGRPHLVPADLLQILRPDGGAIDPAPVGVSYPDAGIAAAQI